MDIEIVSSVRYGKYRQFLDRAKAFKKITQCSELLIKEAINLPQNLKIVIRPIRGLYGTAVSFNIKAETFYVVEIDVRQTVNEFCDTLLHELIHIEQYYEGRLDLKSEHSYSIFEGRKIRAVSNNSAEYNDLPWEKEAIKRSATLKQIIYK